ncbi:hypothetical protein HMPREF1144_1908 [Klebsiella sp. OBRC7]|nr:hypothetical protein HMPREF1144_1908 [Klebsiella sp. OBRC7]
MTRVVSINADFKAILCIVFLHRITRIVLLYFVDSDADMTK